MLDFDEAQQHLASAAAPLTGLETVNLAGAAGRILANAVVATLDLPPADNSAMDGYAIRHADYQPGCQLPIQQRCFAGQSPEPLLPGNAIRLFTGSLLPQGADTVIMQEDCAEADNTVEIKQMPAKGSHVRKQGEDVTCGQQILTAGTRLGAAEIALLASQGLAQVVVFPVLKVGILSTGDELIAPGSTRQSQQIYDSNGPMLTALANTLGAHVVHTLHALDTEASLNHAFKQLLADCDLIMTVGGVSVGEKDLVKPTLEKLGGTLDLWRVSMKPGKPVALAKVQGKPVVCLPGNPGSAFAVFTLLVSPLIRTMQGRSNAIAAIQYGKLGAGNFYNESRDEFLRVQCLPQTDGTITLMPYRHQGSGVISALPWATGLARVPKKIAANEGAILAYYDTAHWLV